ncbi:hypothetical protein IAQ67_15780 [Paenibacillus peoriae]|uniref:Uncharacterized protein n=1 Tax=Paenibacillus peoriae TaxID=59893 RepID=A0A7H0Y2P7_9BACL|nr:hypothetical protein [Paenibacillus peoriae]QNR65355.1 hypothetical protein IAQ67_15780 [Paenibacillus peoriae]
MSLQKEVHYYDHGNKKYKIIHKNKTTYWERAGAIVEFNVNIKMKVFWIFYRTVFNKDYLFPNSTDNRVELAKSEYFYGGCKDENNTQFTN